MTNIVGGIWTQPINHICLTCLKPYTDRSRNSKRCPVCRVAWNKAEHKRRLNRKQNG